MSPEILAAALLLSRLHGNAFAMFFLLEFDVEFEVIAELLWGTRAADDWSDASQD